MRYALPPLALVSLAFWSPAFAAAPPPKITTSDLKAMQGEWVLVGLKVCGFSFKQTGSVTVSGGRLKRRGRIGGDVELAVTLDSAKSPKRYWLRDPTDASALTEEGIYHLDGDTLKLCYNGTSILPVSFAGTKAGEILEIYKRKQP